jgi:hypothetical protein
LKLAERNDLWKKNGIAYGSQTYQGFHDMAIKTAKDVAFRRHELVKFNT